MKNKTIKIMFAVFVIWLFWMMPVAFADALTISNVRVESTTDSSALISWKTDISAKSRIDYGKDIQVNKTESDNNLLKNHQMLITGLDKNSDYYFEVSNSAGTETATDNKNGEYYRFHTLAEDSAPLIAVEFPEYHPNNEIDIKGRTEINTIVEVYMIRPEASRCF